MLQSVKPHINNGQSALEKAIADLERTQDRLQQDYIYSRLLHWSTGVAANNGTNFDQKCLDKIRCLRSEYVFSMENEWARKISSGAAKPSDLANFQYFRSYEEMVRSEYEYLSSICKKPLSKIIFVGSGPFPFSSFCLAKNFGVRVVNVDIDQEAIHTSQVLTRKYELEDKFDFICCDAKKLKIPKDADVVLIAALVGHHADEKHQIINSLGNSIEHKQFLAARTALGLKQLFYVGVDKSKVCHEYVGTSNVPKEVINSLMVFKRR